MLETEMSINIASELKETLRSLKKTFSDACELALKRRISGKQLVLMTESSSRNTGHALMIEN